jgi:hypothetical protein
MKTAVLGCDKTKFEILIQGFHGIISHQPWIKREAEERSEIKNQKSKLKTQITHERRKQITVETPQNNHHPGKKTFISCARNQKKQGRHRTMFSLVEIVTSFSQY